MNARLKWKVAVVVVVGSAATAAGILYVLRNAQFHNMSE